MDTVLQLQAYGHTVFGTDLMRVPLVIKRSTRLSQLEYYLSIPQIKI